MIIISSWKIELHKVFCLFEKSKPSVNIRFLSFLRVDAVIFSEYNECVLFVDVWLLFIVLNKKLI